MHCNNTIQMATATPPPNFAARPQGTPLEKNAMCVLHEESEFLTWSKKLPRTIEAATRISGFLRTNGYAVSCTLLVQEPEKTAKVANDGATSVLTIKLLSTATSSSGVETHQLIPGVHVSPSRWPLSAPFAEYFSCVESVSLCIADDTLRVMLVERADGIESKQAAVRHWEASQPGFTLLPPSTITDVDPIIPVPYDSSPAAKAVARAVARLVIARSQMRGDRAKVSVTVKKPDGPQVTAIPGEAIAFVVVVTGIKYVGPSVFTPHPMWVEYLTEPVCAALRTIVDLTSNEIRVAVWTSTITQTDNLMKKNPMTVFAGIPFYTEQKEVHAHRRPHFRQIDDDDEDDRRDASTDSESSDEREKLPVPSSPRKILYAKRRKHDVNGQTK